MLIHGWGRYPRVEARQHEPADVDGLRAVLESELAEALASRAAAG